MGMVDGLRWVGYRDFVAGAGDSPVTLLASSLCLVGSFPSFYV